MNVLRTIFLTLALMTGLSPAIAQTFPVVGPNTVIGRLGGGTSGPSQQIPFATLFSQFTGVSLPTVANNIVCFSNTTGQLKDCASSVVLTTPTVNGLITQTTSSPGASELISEAHDALMAAGNCALYVLGRDESNYDRATLGFCYGGLNSVNNYGWLGLYGQNCTVKWDGNGNVGINVGCSTTLTKQFQVGSNFSVDSSGNIINAGNINSGGVPTFTGRGGTFGGGGTGSNNSIINLNGQSGSQGGTAFNFQMNGTGYWYLGDNASIFGGGGHHFLIYNETTIPGAMLDISDTDNSAHFKGSIVSNSPTGGVGYEPGAGCSQTQTSSRTNGVTCNTVALKITLVSAAGSSTPATFTVTDSAIGADDTIGCTQVSGANTYRCYGSNIAAGTSFKLTQAADVGTATEAPVFNVTITKGAHN